MERGLIKKNEFQGHFQMFEFFSLNFMLILQFQDERARRLKFIEFFPIAKICLDCEFKNPETF